jgi:hypothetical protein
MTMIDDAPAVMPAEGAGTSERLARPVARLPRSLVYPLTVFGLLISAVLLFTGNALLFVIALGSVVTLLAILRARVDRLIPFALLITFAFDNPAEQPYSGLWNPPWRSFSEVWFNNIRKTIPGTFLPISPLLFVLIICSVRALSSASNRQSDGSTLLLRKAATLSFLTLMVLEVFGIATGGNIDSSFRQMSWLAAVPIIAMGISTASRSTPQLIRRIELAVVISAVFKACTAIWLYHSTVGPAQGIAVVFGSDGRPITPPEYVSTHSDSTLWFWALLLLVGYWIEGRRKGSFLTLVLLGSPLLYAIKVNDRRTTYLQLGIAFAFTLALARPTLKRQIGRVVSGTWPIVLMYFAVGWFSHSPIFAPVEAVKSIFNSNDGSNITRDVENFNLIITSRVRPITGWGFGHEYIEVVKSFDISSALKEYRFIPHNSLLGLFAFAGPIGFLGFWSVVVTAVALCVRAYRSLPRERTAAATKVRVRAGWAASGLIGYALVAYADIGLQSVYPALIAGLCCGIAGTCIRDATELRRRDAT